LPVSIIRINTARKLLGYGEPCYRCSELILDLEYVARSGTNGTKYYHDVCALSVNLVDNLRLMTAETPFKANRKDRSMSRGLRKKIIFFGREKT
jgi:hypothetical protein